MAVSGRFWDQSFIDLIDLPGVIEAVTELACDERRWGRLGARGQLEPPRLGHHNIFLRSAWGSGAPLDTGGGLHGGNSRDEGKTTISVAYELCDVGPDEGGFSCIPGSHHPDFALPVHDGWRRSILLEFAMVFSGVSDSLPLRQRLPLETLTIEAGISPAPNRAAPSGRPIASYARWGQCEWGTH